MNKKITAILFATILLASCGVSRTTISKHKNASSIQDNVIEYSRKYLGKPYRSAGKGPDSFDCSGFTYFVFKEFGYKLNASSSGQEKQFPTVVQKDELKKGDLVFFEGKSKNGRVGHVGIVTEVRSDGTFNFIHASTNYGVIVSSSAEPYYASRYLHGGRVIDTGNEQNDNPIFRTNNDIILRRDSVDIPEPVVVNEE